MTSAWMRPVPRLGLVAAICGLIALAFAYWWLGNTVHELAGLAVCLFLLRHLVNNLSWWRRLSRGQWTAARVLSTVLTLLLAVDTVALVATSLMISQSLREILPMPGEFVLREIHWFSAYWLLVLAGLHLGLNLRRMALFLSQATGGRAVPGPVRAGLWAAALVVGWIGIESGTVIGLWTRLSFGYSMSMWDFNASVLPYFLHVGAVAVLMALLGHGAGLVSGMLPRVADRRRPS